MKLVLLSVLTAMLAIGSFAQVKPARTDQLVTQLPNPMPTWGGGNGPLGQKFCNPAFNDRCMIRLTNATTRMNHGSLTTADTGEVQLGTMDSRHIVVRTKDGTSVLIAFDPATGVPTSTPLAFNYIVVPSETDASKLYVLHGTQIQQLTVNADWTAVVSQVVLFDFASKGCLGASFLPKWHGVFSVSGNPEVFGTSFSNTGPQGTGRYVTVWSAAKGCSVWDTVTGLVNTSWQGPLGRVVTPGRFYMHAGGIGANPLYATTDPTWHQLDGKTPGCLIVAGCATQYFWRWGTREVFDCGRPFNKPPYCSGHIGQTMTAVLSGRDYEEHFWNNPEHPLTSFGFLGSNSPDSHQSGTNGADINGPPLIIASQQVNSPQVYPTWGYNEIMQLRLDGTKRVERLVQNLNTGNSKIFVCADGIATALQNKPGIKKYVLFTSDAGGNGALGIDVDGTSRCDVFAAEADYQ